MSGRRFSAPPSKCDQAIGLLGGMKRQDAKDARTVGMMGPDLTRSRPADVPQVAQLREEAFRRLNTEITEITEGEGASTLSVVSVISVFSSGRSIGYEILQ